MEKSWETNARLPCNIIPLHYNLTLHPDLKNGTFSGSEEITISVLKEQDCIILHSVNLDIKSCSLKSTVSNEEIAISERFSHEKNEFYVIVLNAFIKPGKYHLNLSFAGSLLDKIIGFYRSSYSDFTTGEKRYIATSKFEPTYARQAFPCFDEPNFKAEFTIQLVRPSQNNYIALSNMNQVSEKKNQPLPDLTTVYFAKSVPMSTYLACFIVCDFDCLEAAHSKQGFPINVYARTGLVKNMRYALQLAAKTIDYYIDYFGIDYPLPKLDLIAIPDFVSGAMEHWGLVTFRETSVLFNEAVTSSINKKNVSYTVTHELAHMWFGNLVTMKWWNDLWLNEGFATFISYKGTDHSHAEWDVRTQVLTDEVHNVLSLDSVLSSHPIVQDVSHPDQITEIFDTISYCKGATVIRMLENMIGEEGFRIGVSSYLKEFAFKNAETKDLWNHLEKVSGGVNISQVMGTWTCQMGYPLVDVKRERNKIVVTQQRFLANSSFLEKESSFGYKWDIQLTYVTSVNPNEVYSHWLLHDQTSVEIALPEGTTWFKFNNCQFGYYRVRYSSEDWQKLANMLLNDHERITVADRANLLDDAFSLAKAGYIPYKVAFDLLKYLPNERHFIPWIVISQKLKFLLSILTGTPVYSKFRKFLHDLLKPVAKDNLWNISAAESYVERRRKHAVLDLCCSLRLTVCVNRAKLIFTDWLFNNGAKPEVEFRYMVYSTGMSKSGEEEWEKLWQMFEKEEEPQEKVKLINALTAIQEPWLINRLIELAKNENNVRSQDFILLLIVISDNPVGNPIIWDFMRANWAYLVKRFTLNNRLLGRLIPCVTANFSSHLKLNELKLFLSQNPEAGAGAAGRKNALERILNNIDWLGEHLCEFEM